MDLLSIVLPSIIVLLTAYLLLDRFLKNEEKRRIFELKKQNLSTLTPIRLRAYERLALFLERTSPNTLILDVIKPDMNCSQLHVILLETIRKEYSHNISQQIYVSNDLWMNIHSVKENLIKLFNTCAASCNPNDQATILAERIIQIYSDAPATPTEIALAQLKTEVKEYF